MYVRIPLRNADEDLKFPRSFAMAQIEQINLISELVKVTIHDLHHSKAYYRNVFATNKFYASELVRCIIPKGTMVITPKGKGVILSYQEKGPEEFVVYVVYHEIGVVLNWTEDEIQADYATFYVDPALMLARYEFQNPSWFASRNVVSSTSHVLNSAVYGFKELAGCRIVLLPHQIITILRCLEQFPVRYMLADEVGLGKTVEACSIIKITEAHQKDLKVLYVLPTTLTKQWQYELMTKFAIKTAYYSHEKHERHVLLTFDQLNQINVQEILSRKFDFIVVDEVHNALYTQSLYTAIKSLSENIPNVLLLSATPIQSRKQEYLNLLRLLDSSQYDGTSAEAFSALVDRQIEIQQQLFTLMVDIESFDESPQWILDQVQSLVSYLEDEQLNRLLSSADLNHVEKTKALVLQVVAYISEHYRIEKHVVRNRRALLTDYVVPRKFIPRSYSMIGSNELYGEADAIESLLDWLDTIKENSELFIANIAQPLLSRAFSSVWALRSKLESMTLNVPLEVMNAVSEWERAANIELMRVDDLLDSEPDDIRGRLIHALDFLEQETNLLTDDHYKVVIFSDFAETAERFFKVASERFGAQVVKGFYKGLSNDELEDSVNAFQTSPECKVLVCDESGGEGRNFQMADLLVHLDTPWSPNKLEQRIGRLDRLGRDQEKEVLSVVFYANTSIDEQLVQLWSTGLGVYEQTLSGLEIVSGEILDKVFIALQENLRYGLTYSMPQIQEEVTRMRKQVREEEFFDISPLLYGSLSNNIKRTLEIYQGKDDEIFAEAMISWAEQAGFRPVPLQTSQLLELKRESFSPASSINALLIPPDWNSYFINPKINRQGRIIGTFNRDLAIERENLLFYAPGDPVFDAITNNALNCYRGQVSAFTTEDAPFSFAGVVFTWNIEPALEPLLTNDIDPLLLAQFRSFLPLDQIVTAYPINDRYEGVNMEELELFLKTRYLVRKSVYLGRRRNSVRGPAIIETFINHYPPEFWTSWVNQARSACQQQAMEIVKTHWTYEVAETEVTRKINATLAARRHFGLEEERFEQIDIKYEAVLSALRNFKVQLDSAIYIKVGKE